MDDHIIEQFFEPIRPVVFEKGVIDYSKLEYVSLLLDRIGDIMPHDTYIVDYLKKRFFFISKESSLLCGYTMEEAMEWGYGLFSRILSPEDLEKLLEINEAGFKLYYKYPVEKILDASISYDLVFHKKNGVSFCVSHKLKPFLLTPDGNLWMSVCTLRQSSNNETGNVRLYFKEANERYSYSFATKGWKRLSSIELNRVEKHILMETDKGVPEKQIAASLNCSRANISYYKARLLKKTDSKNIREVIAFFQDNGLLQQ